MTARLVILIVCFLTTAAYARHAMRPEELPPRTPIDRLTNQVGRWAGREAPKFTDEVLAVLGADELVNRWYGAPQEPAVALYVGYYKSQREGDTIHSPMNCLPGAGWLPVANDQAAIDVPGRTAPIVVNRFVIQKGADRQVVLYWYQSNGRIVANEYWSKAYMVYDAVRRHRSDAAIIRVISPVLPNEDGTAAAERRVTEFVQALFPHLETHLPS
ncbi:MAG TPA: EpsI family protein [Vicinamibacterales bacterium]|nr:EpsI family protein [Vicinamibacterales bacterium]